MCINILTEWPCCTNLCKPFSRWQLLVLNRNRGRGLQRGQRPLPSLILMPYNLFSYNYETCLKIFTFWWQHKMNVVAPAATADSAATTGGALAANPWPLRTHFSYPACIASGNFILEFPSINSRSRLFSRWRMRARSVEQTTSLAAAHASTWCMLGMRGEFEGSPYAMLRDGSPLSRYLYM